VYIKDDALAKFETQWRWTASRASSSTYTCSQKSVLDSSWEGSEAESAWGIATKGNQRLGWSLPFIPPHTHQMAPYLETVKSFADVPVTDAGVDTVGFLEASQGLLGIFDLLGSAAFTPVQADIKGNIAKVRARYDAAPAQSGTLELLVENEKGEKKRTATEGLMWLLRGLSFTCKALQNSQANKTEELAAAFGNSYEATLKKHHNFVVKGIFAVAMKACPYRAEFYAKLAADPAGGAPASDARLDKVLNSWLAALDGDVQRLQEFYAKEGHNKGL